MIARVKQMVMDDRRLTVKQTVANAGISFESVDTILHNELKMRKVSAKWVPRMLTDEKSKHIPSIFKDESTRLCICL
jgi:histone-lysine N-methyltransferase SETMAR